MKRFLKLLNSNRIVRLDIVMLALFLVSGLFWYLNSERIQVSLDRECKVENAWLATTDRMGNIYVVDNNRSRILILNDKKQVLEILTDFSYIDDLIVDNEGNIYVIDTRWAADSFRVNADVVYRYNIAESVKEELFTQQYESATKHQMFGLSIVNQQLQVVSADDDKVILYGMSQPGQLQQLKEYEYEDAITMLQDIDICTGTGDIYGLDKRGSVVRFHDNGYETVYDWSLDNARQKTQPYRIEVSENGILYMTDIVSNRLLCIEKGVSKVLTTDRTGLFNVTLGEDEEGESVGICVDSNFEILDTEGNIKVEGTQIVYSLGLYAVHVLSCVLLGILILACCWFSLRILCLLFRTKMNAVQKMSRVVMLTVAIVAGIVVFQMMGEFKTMLREEKLSKLELVANNVSRSIHEEDMAAVQSTTDYMNDGFRQLMAAMENNVDYTFDDSMYVNIVRYDQESDQVYDVAFLDCSIGAYYPLEGSEAEEVIRVYETGESLRSNSVTENGGFTYVKVPILDRENNVIGVVEVGTWADVLTGQIKAIARDVLTQLAVWLVLVLFIFSEIFEILNLRMSCAGDEGDMIPLHVNRGMIFLVFTAYNLPTSFLPVYVAKMYENNWNMPSGIATSLPISINMALLGGAALIGFKLLKHFSFQKAMFGSALFSMAGDFILATASNYTMILLGLMLNGIGVGLQMNLVHTIITCAAEKKKDNSIYTIYQAGSLSGIMVGMALGAILANFIGYKMVFLATVLIWCVIAVVSMTIGSRVRLDYGRENEQKKTSSLRKFLFTRETIPFLVFILFLYVMISSFVYYYVPIYCDSLGFGSDISCIFIMLSSVCGIYLSSAATKFFTKHFGKGAMYISSAISLTALVIFAYIPSPNMMIITLLLIGFGSSFGAATRLSAFAALPQTMDYGADQATGVYDAVERAGEAVGPMLFASLFAGNFRTGIWTFVGISVTGELLYVLISFRRKKNEGLHHE